MHYLRQSTASQEILLGPFVDSTDGSTAETALTINASDIKIWKHGATTEANKNSGGATHIAAGRYYAVLDATDTDTVGMMEINVSVSGALPVRRPYMVLEEAIYDMLFASSANGDSAGITTLLTRIASALTITSGRVDSNVTHFNGTAGTFSSGRPEVNTSHWGGTAVASATVRSDLINISGAAVNTSSAQLGVNVVNWGGTATGSANVRSNLIQISGSNVSTSSAQLGVNVVNWGGTATSSAIVRANTLQINSDSVAAQNAELFFDGTGYNASNSTIGTATNVTNAVTAGTVTDKTGYSLTQSFPTNFSSLSIDGSGNVTALNVSAIKTVTDRLDTALELDGAVYRFTSNALEQAPSSGLDAAGIRSAVGLASANLDTQLSGIQTGVNSILGSTGSTLSAIPWNPAWDSEVQSECADALAAYAPLTSFGANAPAGWINAASIAASALNGKGDWNIGKTGYSLSSTQAFNLTGNVTGNLSGSVGSVTNAVSVSSASINSIADQVWDEAYNQHTTAGTFGKLMDILRKANYTTDGTVAAGATPTTTTFRTDLTQPDDTYDHQTLLFLSGNLEGESKPILAYQQANGVITLDEPLTEAPQIGDSFIILPIHVHPLSIIRSEIFGQEIESGLSFVKNQRLQSAILGALLSGAGSGTEVFKAALNPATTRVTVTVDQSGNRTNIVYNLD